MKRQQQIQYCYHTSEAKFITIILCLVTETAYYLHIVFALHLHTITI